MRKYATGGLASTIDLRDFAFEPTGAKRTGGERYKEEDINPSQKRVGICTSASLVQNVRKATGKDFSAEFQYLIQKKFYDGNWIEGSSNRSALTVAKKYGFLPVEEWKATTLADRQLNYSDWIKKLQNISEKEMNRMLAIAEKNKVLTGYASVPIDRDLLALAIDESKSGLLVRFVIDNQWYREPIEPLRRPVNALSGHIVTISNYDGMSYRIANSWGKDWCDKGTAYGLLTQYQPTEAWIPYYEDTPEYIAKKQEELKSLQWQAIGLLQKLLNLLQLKK